ncbi:unnamed protein product [Sphagnum troendelagicum]
MEFCYVLDVRPCRGIGALDGGREHEITRTKVCRRVVNSRDDAEEAESQASIAREGEQNQILNTSLLEKIHEEYIGKIKGIQHVHFAAMEPILACIKQEVRQSKQECAEGMIKIKPCTKKCVFTLLDGCLDRQDWVMIFPCIHQCKPMVITKLGAKLLRPRIPGVH